MSSLPASQASARARMVEAQLVRRGIRDARILEAFRRVPREAFVPASLARAAFDDGPLPIEAGQTISQPYVVAWMLELLAVGPDDVLLDVGTGSGYAAAIASELVSRVVSIERIEELARTAAERLSRLGFDRVEVHVADGSRGWARGAPYDAIMVGAAAPSVPEALVGQLAMGGRLVVPVGPREDVQELVRVTRTERGPRIEPMGGVRFVPLVGDEGYARG
ncbi:MAG: protein-L-isoaspartate(D-aspartate) O-methyltransferase [Sandaracinus sp.]